jgi:hypothetical protein
MKNLTYVGGSKGGTGYVKSNIMKSSPLKRIKYQE